jgi:hypothetical protein
MSISGAGSSPTLRTGLPLRFDRRRRSEGSSRQDEPTQKELGRFSAQASHVPPASEIVLRAGGNAPT